MRVTCHVIIFIIGLSPERCNYEVTQHPLKSVLGLCPRESGFCSSETKHGANRRQEQSCFFRRGDQRRNATNSKSLSWFRIPMNMVSVELQ